MHFFVALGLKNIFLHLFFCQETICFKALYTWKYNLIEIVGLKDKQARLVGITFA